MVEAPAVDKKPEFPPNKKLVDHPAGRVRYGGLQQYLRVLTCVIYLAGGIILIFLTQCLGAPIYFLSRSAYYTWMSRTKAHFGVHLTTLTQWWSPTVVRVTGDQTVKDQIYLTKDGSLRCDFPERIVLIANHQLYSDWIYLWWIAYTAKMHSYLYIILKESLKYIPVLGQGMVFYGFIFLSRRWEQDKLRFEHGLNTLSKGERANDPMWLLIFPEGTNASQNGRKTSAKYAEKIGIQDLKHTLLPRTTGLAFCLKNLEQSVEWMYDCTVAYEGIPKGKFGQDYFTLFSTCFEGRPPKSVNMHFRRFRIKDIPIHDIKEFDVWLRERWKEKDNLLEYYDQYGTFPEAVNGADGLTGTEANGTAEQRYRKQILETEVKLESVWEVLNIYSTFGAVLLLVHLIRTFCAAVLKITVITSGIGDL